MIKYYCDRCKSEINKERSIGCVAVNTRDKVEGILQEDNEFAGWFFCKRCTEDIKKFVRKVPELPNDNADIDKETEPKEKKSVKKKAEKAECDVGKIMALKKAGWSIEDIAGEMKMSQQEITQQIDSNSRKLNTGKS